MSRQYLSKDEIHDLLGDLHPTEGFSLVKPNEAPNIPQASNQSYNEEAIAQKIKSLGTEAEQLLLEATINNAVVGYGQKRFGLVKIEDHYLQIHRIYQRYGVLMNLRPGANVAEDELTPNRLMRFFRHFIRDWIREKQVGGYMWRKYSSRDPKMMHICFRGAEYLEDLTKEEADYLLQTTINMDRVLGTTFTDRVQRAYDARGQQYTPISGQDSTSQSGNQDQPTNKGPQNRTESTSQSGNQDQPTNKGAPKNRTDSTSQSGNQDQPTNKGAPQNRTESTSQSGKQDQPTNKEAPQNTNANRTKVAPE
jgi:hypothetical protein